LIPFPKKKYKIIYADPPWKYYTITKDSNIDWNHAVDLQYETMEIDEIKKLPVKQISDDICMLFLWVTFPNLQEGLDVIKAWGFKYKTLGFAWVKTSSNNNQPRNDGMGFYTRSNCEVCLIGVKGKSLVINHGISNTILAPRKQHSQKPNQIRDKIVKLCGDLPRIELFARTKVHGWDVWGNDPKLENKPLEAFN